MHAGQTSDQLLLDGFDDEELAAWLGFTESGCKGLGKATIRRIYELFGRSLADAVHYMSPEAIFLFGGPVAAGEILFKPTRESLERYLLPFYRNKIKLLPSKLKAGSAAIVGASALVWKELDKSKS